MNGGLSYKNVRKYMCQDRMNPYKDVRVGIGACGIGLSVKNDRSYLVKEMLKASQKGRVGGVMQFILLKKKNRV